MEDLEPRLLRLAAAGHLLGISEFAVRRLVRQGELRTVRVFADQRIPLEEIDNLVRRKLDDAANAIGRGDEPEVPR
jgi:hypothetical protein